LINRSFLKRMNAQDLYGAGELPVPAMAGVSDIAERPLANLLKRHRNLRRSIKTLIVQSGRRYEDEAGLWEAMQTHEKMEWMLAALIDAGAMPRRRDGQGRGGMGKRRRPGRPGPTSRSRLYP
jgi:hypothetical protein